MNRTGSKEGARDVVLLHGWGTNAAVWREVAKRLGPGFRTHAPLLPFGASQPEAFASLDDIADHLARWAPPRCVVCGWSLGGVIALAWALRAPEQVTRLALIATSPCFVQRADWRYGLEPRAVRDFARGLARQPAGVLTRYIALQARGDIRAARVARHLRQTLTLAPRPEAAALERGLALLCETDLRRTLLHIQQPVLAIHGARDAVVPAAAGEFVAQALPHARFSLIETAAHAPFASEPEIVSTQLSGFFHGR